MSARLAVPGVLGLFLLWFGFSIATCAMSAITVAALLSYSGSSVPDNSKACPTPPLPNTQRYVTNRQGARLHTRISLPPGGASGIKACCYFMHGYGAHTNRGVYPELAQAFANHGVAVIMWDLRSHGYSDGLPGLLPEVDQLVEDALDVKTCCESEGQNHCLGMSEAVRASIRVAPVFAMGQSLGGALTLLFSMKLQQQCPRFHGMLLAAPAIQGVLPPKPILLFLKHIVAPLFKKRSIPTFLDSTTNLEAIWIREEDVLKYSQDELSFHDPMRFGTAVALVNMLDLLALQLPKVECPFIVFHDPADKVCRFGGSEELVAKSCSAVKELVVMKDMRHDLVTNCSDKLVEHGASWMMSQIAAKDQHL